MEIQIESPIPTYEAIDRMDSILKDPKWNRELSEKEKKHVYPRTKTFSRILEDSFLTIIGDIRTHLFNKPAATSLVGRKMTLISRDFSWGIEGNIAEIDKTKLVDKILEQAKQEVARAKSKPPAPPPPKPSIKSCITYFYPPIWVGKPPSKTFKEKAHGSFIFRTKKALNLEYKGRIVIIGKDGLITIGEEDIPKATRMLNEIMATFLLMDFEASAVRELEVGTATVDSQSLTVASWGIRTDTLRTQLAYPFRPQQLLEYRLEVGKEDLIKVIRQAERISEDPDLSDFLIFFLEANTHLRNSEYSQSFIMSWVIVERHLFWLWNKFVKEERMPRKRRDKLTNPVYWTTDFVIEGLNIDGRFSQGDYEDLMSLKSKRNDIIHLGEGTTLAEAEKCFRIASDIVKQRSSLE
ncbi:hypothetical protein KAU55_02755 [Candidatus Bathyarchaeota archaeon]|nr:hypothetical protein [Candidatus Bathyarchaeota archaeon]